MQVVVAIAVLIGLALLSAGAARRSIGNRLAAMAVSGLWGAALVGVMLGPDATGLINQGTRQEPGTRELATPLVMATLGWVGMMIGLQARRDVLRRVPAPVWRLVWMDALVTAAVWGPIAWMAVSWAFAEARADARVGVFVVLVASMLGWSSETRSVRAPGTARADEPEFAVRASGAIASIATVCVFGLGGFAVVAVRRRILDPDSVAIGVVGGVAWVVLAVVAGGVLGRLGLSLAGRSRGNQLVAFLGTLTLVAGVATKVGASAMLCCALVGAAIGNAKGFGAREFERYLFRAEITVATLLGLLVGIACSLEVRGPDAAVVAAMVGWRIVAKPWIARLGFGAPAGRDVVRFGVMRAHPIGLAAALALTLMIGREESGRVCLMMVATTLVCDLSARWLSRRRERTDAVVPAQGSAA